MIETKMRQRIEEIYTVANKKCGLSYELFLELFSNGIRDEIIKNTFDDSALFEKIATDEFDYIPNYQVEFIDGLCRHGIELGCCPAGCGS